MKKYFFLFFIIYSIYGYSEYGINILNGIKKSNREFEIEIKTESIINLFYILNKCDICDFKINDIFVSNGHIILITYYNDIMSIYLNNNNLMNYIMMNRCFFCIQKKFL